MMRNNELINGKSIRLIVVIMLLTLFTAGCQWRAAWHKYFMSGQIVEVEQGRIVACVANIEYAQRGTVLSVYRVTRISEFDDFDEVDHRWEREEIGQVVVDSVVDKHFIKATIMVGDVRQYDIVSSN